MLEMLMSMAKLFLAKFAIGVPTAKYFSLEMAFNSCVLFDT